MIVHDDVNSAAGAVTVQLRQVQRLRHNSLPGERRIAVHEQRQNLSPMLGIAANALPRARFAFDDWIDSFQMARVRREPDLDLRARTRAFARRR